MRSNLYLKERLLDRKQELPWGSGSFCEVLAIVLCDLCQLTLKGFHSIGRICLARPCEVGREALLF
jgi:hypothetical protein